MTDLVVVTVVGAVNVVGTVSVVELVTVLVVVPVLLVVEVTVVGTVVVTVLVVPVVTVVVKGTEVVAVVVFVVVLGLVTVVDTVAVVDVVLVVFSVVVVGFVVVVVVVDEVVVVWPPPHEFDRTKSSPSGPVSCSDGSFVPASVTNALVSVAPPSASTTTPMKPPVFGCTRLMDSTDPPVNVAVKSLVLVKSQFCVAGTMKCHQESELSGDGLSGMSVLLQMVLVTPVGTCDDMTHSVPVAHAGADVSPRGLFAAGAARVPNPMNARPAVHSAAPASRTPIVELKRLRPSAERFRSSKRFSPPPITRTPS